MPVLTIDASMISRMFIGGAKYLESQKELINELNVFPVPDGDTGTNMTLTIMSAAAALSQIEEPDMESFSKAVSQGSLRGARGNSGVILSQLLRGFTRGIRDYEELDTVIIAGAMTKAVYTAYKAVMKPKEGTILTVAKELSEKANNICEIKTDLTEFFEEVMEAGEAALENTPELLPVLKEAGVVDSGGKGLMTVLQGAVDVFNGKEVDLTVTPSAKTPERFKKRGHIETDDIKFGYCTEFIIMLEKKFGERDEKEMKKFLTSIGDSLVLVADSDMVKIHVHTNDPGLAIQRALKYGQLTSMKIDNMREEHKETIFKEAEKEKAESSKKTPKDVGFLAVSVGNGIDEIFKELGVDMIVQGGQTMNPSTDDILNAISEVGAKDVFILPNNKNIILAANQAKELSDDVNVYVVPTKTIPQGITAMVNYIKGRSAEENLKNMTDSISTVKSGEITYAVRDTSIDNTPIHKGDIMGIGDNGLLDVGSNIEDVVIGTLEKIVDEDSELISIYNGEDLPDDKFESIKSSIEEKFPDCEVESNYGGQPVYYCIISVE